MLRVRLKADGRLVEVLPDGSERADRFSDGQTVATRATAAAFARTAVSSMPPMPAMCAAGPA